MSSPDAPRILIVDDEEAILETMTFTFMDVYRVLTTSNPHEAVRLLDENAPVAVVITDQRMPEMTGVELLKKVYERHPDTVRIILTGFADSEATIKAINDGHVYAYINKPWEPDELKTVVRRAVELNRLTCENRRLLADLQSANSIMQAVMDKLDVGAVAVDQQGLVRAANAPALVYLGIEGDPRGQSISKILACHDGHNLVDVVKRLAEEHGGGFEDIDLAAGARGHRVRVSVQPLAGPRGEPLGRVVRFKEISHEPLRREFEEIVDDVARADGSLRSVLEQALAKLGDLLARVEGCGISSPAMAELGERISRGQTAMQSWLDVDELLHRDEFPDAQLLRDRMRLANKRWPRRDGLPRRVEALGRRVEDYYESGENPRERVL
ncbi:MAG TPA: response regulator [Planctomycetota bacterium]|nr:response regulator [Planctomycetota bacterium]